MLCFCFNRKDLWIGFFETDFFQYTEGGWLEEKKSKLRNVFKSTHGYLWNNLPIIYRLRVLANFDKHTCNILYMLWIGYGENI